MKKRKNRKSEINMSGLCTLLVVKMRIVVSIFFSINRNIEKENREREDEEKRTTSRYWSCDRRQGWKNIYSAENTQICRCCGVKQKARKSKIYLCDCI